MASEQMTQLDGVNIQFCFDPTEQFCVCLALSSHIVQIFKIFSFIADSPNRTTYRYDKQQRQVLFFEKKLVAC